MFVRPVRIVSRQPRLALVALGRRRWDALSSLAPNDHAATSVDESEAPTMPTKPVDWRERFRGKSPAQQQQQELMSRRPRFTSRRDRDNHFRDVEEVPTYVSDLELESVVKLACTADGSRRLRDMIAKAEHAKLEQMAQQILSDPRPLGLLKNEHCGRFIRKLIEVGDHDLKWSLGSLMRGYMWKLAMHKHGNFVVDDVLVHVHMQLRDELVEELLSKDDEIQRCAMNKHGRFPLCNIIECGTPQELARVAAALKGHVVAMATDLQGRRTIQACLRSFDGQEREALIGELLGVTEGAEDSVAVRTRGFLLLAKHEHGTFVAQTLVETSQDHQGFIVAALTGQIKNLALHPAGTFVVDAAVRYLEDWALEQVAAELSQDAVAECARDEHGCKAIQSFLENGFSAQRQLVVEMMRGNALDLAMHPTGHRCVLSVIQGAEHSADIVDVIDDKYDLSNLLDMGENQGQEVSNADDYSNDSDAFAADNKDDLSVESSSTGADNEADFSVAGIYPSAENKEDVPVDTSYAGDVRAPDADFVATRAEFMKELLSPDGVMKLSANEYGSGVLRKVLEVGTDDEIVAVYEGLKENSRTVTRLASTKHGSELLESAMKLLPPLERDGLVDAILFAHKPTNNAHANNATATNQIASTGNQVESTESANQDAAHWTSDRHASKFVRELLQRGTKQQVEAIVYSLKDQMVTLVKDPDTLPMVIDALRFADDPSQLALELFLSGENAVVDLALHPVATDVIQYLLEHGLPEHQVIIADAMKGHMAKLAVTLQGSKLIQASFKVLTKERVDELLGELLVVGASAKSPGKLETPSETPRVDSEVSSSDQIIDLIKTKYSNLLIQAMIKFGTDEHREAIFEAMLNRLTELAVDKHGCFVVQCAFEHVLNDEAERTGLIVKLTDDEEGLKQMYKSKYGKFVLEMILEHGSKIDVYAVEKAIAAVKTDAVLKAQS
jgi:hypothetical protein